MQQEKLLALFGELSLEEKIGELFQLPPYFFDGGNATGPAEEMGICSEDIRVAGSCLSLVGAGKIAQVQKLHMENHPHRIPMLFMADIINGYRTVFPIPLAQGCTFDPALTQECAAIAAKESAASGIHVTFSPMADLVRDARWGRVMESTGEDPYLNGLMAAAMVRGYQGEDKDHIGRGKLAACVKHFAGYGAPEGGRDYNTVELSTRTLRQDYLPGYQAAIDAGAALVMTSFNTLDRVPSSANAWLMRKVLREEMGFDGVLISDWAAIQELIVHGIAEDAPQAATLALNAGVDIDMATPVYIKNLKALVEQGKVSQTLIDEAALRVLMLKNKLGLFENPYKDASEADEASLLLCESHREAARACAEKTFVLLKNEGELLPLSREETVAFIGPYVDSRFISGAWSIFGDDDSCVTAREGVQGMVPGAKAQFAPGCTLVDPGVEIMGFQKKMPKGTLDPEAALTEAVKLASTADKVVLLLGEPRDFSGECASRSELTLPQCQMRLLEQVCKVNPRACVVLFNGRPLDLRQVSEASQAVLEAWLPGTEGGNALARVLYGLASPCGKLSMSMPYCVGQVPVYYSHMRTGRPLLGDYRTTKFCSQYLDIPNEPLYPFGYGLSYTTFAYSDVKLDRPTLSKGETIRASVRVTNTGTLAGTETVQLYIQDVAGSVTRPVRELKGFRKLTLAPGDMEEVAFCITEDMLRFYTLGGDYASEPGTFRVYIGPDSRAEHPAEFTLV